MKMTYAVTILNSTFYKFYSVGNQNKSSLSSSICCDLVPDMEYFFALWYSKCACFFLMLQRMAGGVCGAGRFGGVAGGVGAAGQLPGAARGLGSRRPHLRQDHLAVARRRVHQGGDELGARPQLPARPLRVRPPTRQW